MSSNTKIFVLRSKELVYALVLFIISLLIILIAVSLFLPSDGNASNSDKTPAATETPSGETSENNSTDSAAANQADLYIPGIYSSTLQLGSSNVELQITVDKNHINSITLTNIDEAVATMYPLMEPTLSELSSKILAAQSLDDISFTDESRYTSLLLMQAISDSLEKAKAVQDAECPADSLTTDKLQ